MRYNTNKAKELGNQVINNNKLNLEALTIYRDYMFNFILIKENSTSKFYGIKLNTELPEIKELDYNTLKRFLIQHI